MTLPSLPSQGSTSWYAWAQGIHEAVESGGSGSTDAETVRDTMAMALTAGSGISIVADDASDSITISSETAALGVVNVKDYGAAGNGSTNDSTAIQAALNAADDTFATVIFPPGTYLADNLSVPQNVRVVGLAAEPYRYGGSGVTIKHVAASTNPLMTLAGGGNTLESVTLDGNSATGTVLHVPHGFEARVRWVRIINGGGIGLHIAGAGNADYYNVYVDNCGSASLAGVLISSSSQFINTLDMTGLHIERCKGVHLQIGQVGDTQVPEFLRFTNLHIEATSDSGGVNNTVPLVNIRRARSINMVNPFLYGGPGNLLTYEQSGSEPELGGVVVVGGTLLGKYNGSGFEPTELVDLVAGDEFAMVGTRLDQSSAYGVRLRSGFGDQAYLANLIFRASIPTPVLDSRTSATRKAFARSMGDTSSVGHIVSEQTSARPTIATNQTGAPVALDQHTDTKGIIFFGSNGTPTSGQQVTVTFNRAYASQPAVMLTPGNGATAALGLFVESFSNGTGFRVWTNNAPTASQTVGTYQVAYAVIG